MTKNKWTLETRIMLDKMGCNPIEELAKIAMRPDTEPLIKIRIFSDLAQYYAPKLRAVDVDLSADKQLTMDLVTFAQQTLFGCAIKQPTEATE